MPQGALQVLPYRAKSGMVAESGSGGKSDTPPGRILRPEPTTQWPHPIASFRARGCFYHRIPLKIAPCTKGLFPVQRSSEMMDCTPYRRRGFLVPNIPSVPETPVFYTECIRKRVAYTRSPSTVPRVHSVHQEALSGTECYIGKKEKDLACAEFLKLPEKRRPSLKSGWQLPLKGLSTLGAGGRSRRRQVPR